MAQAEVLFERANQQPDFIAFDVVSEEEHGATAELTEYAVEEGVNISDHHRPDPKTLTLSICVSNTPLEVPQSQVDVSLEPIQFDAGAPKQRVRDMKFKVPPGTAANLTVVGQFSVGIPDGRGSTGNIQVLEPGASEGMSGVMMGFSAEFDRVQAVTDVIHELIENSLICTVITDRRTYPDMLVTGFSDPVTQGGVMKARLTLKQARFADTQRVKQPDTEVSRARTQESQGRQAGIPVVHTEAPSYLFRSAVSSGFADDALDVTHAWGEQ